MKKIIIVLAAFTLFSSCKKMEDWNIFKKEKEKNEKACPSVNSSDVPAQVTKAFEVKYPGASVKHWFTTDNKGYCALFMSGANKKIVLFGQDGAFQKETDINQNQEGNNQNNDCKCHIEDGD
ncbi:MAG TPA: hypothetical protein VNZ49_13465 [Bacteroidia bacterium]|nr:hypothetical protein [Bacteroidia bacterium]